MPPMNILQLRAARRNLSFTSQGSSQTLVRCFYCYRIIPFGSTQQNHVAASPECKLVADQVRRAEQRRLELQRHAERGAGNAGTISQQDALRQPNLAQFAPQPMQHAQGLLCSTQTPASTSNPVQPNPSRHNVTVETAPDNDTPFEPMSGLSMAHSSTVHPRAPEPTQQTQQVQQSSHSTQTPAPIPNPVQLNPRRHKVMIKTVPDKDALFEPMSSPSMTHSSTAHPRTPAMAHAQQSLHSTRTPAPNPNPVQPNPRRHKVTIKTVLDEDAPFEPMSSPSMTHSSTARPRTPATVHAQQSLHSTQTPAPTPNPAHPKPKRHKVTIETVPDEDAPFKPMSGLSMSHSSTAHPRTLEPTQRM
ncbi:hypothetical protein FRC10_004371 [Ceratobasidium sp. 414]|nr:hypothetical protein FRC10_004371 [Ceratobasidium sp. 414]